MSRVIELRSYAYTVAHNLIHADRGEFSIEEDLVQGALLAVMEKPGDTEQDDKNTIRNHIRNALRKHRERGYSVTLWQDSVEALEEDDDRATEGH